jgi:hypothetical protein
MFTLREMCSYLEWELNVDTKTLKMFETMVKKDFAGPGPYPTYLMSMFSKCATDQTPSEALNSSTSPIPSFGHYNGLPMQPPSTPLPSLLAKEKEKQTPSAPSPTKPHHHHQHHHSHYQHPMIQSSIPDFFQLLPLIRYLSL